MSDVRLALRNVLRNRRRTLATVLAVALSCAGLVLFGGYVVWAHRAAETHMVSMTGHLQLFRQGYHEKGGGNPPAYAIENFDAIRRLIVADPELGPRVAFVTGRLFLQGLISYAEKRTSTAFLGLGAFPNDVERLARWNPYDVFDVRRIAANREFFASGPELDPDDPDGVTLGLGLARILEVDQPPATAAAVPAGGDGRGGRPGRDRRPSVDLLSLPPSGGLPNTVSLSVRKLTVRMMEELDNRLVVMPIQKASDLLFPGAPVRVTSIIVVLRAAGELEPVQARMRRLIAERDLNLEMRTWLEMNPNHVRSLQMMDMFFVFIFCVIAVVLIFTIYNTMVMSVVERTREIGTLRAMGMMRSGIVGLFTMEGLLLGAIGGALGLLLGVAGAAIINAFEILYQPPYVPVYAKMEVMVLRVPWMMLASLAGCVLIATLAALMPAWTASRMVVVDALRH